MLTAEELKVIKMLQNNPELLARVQDENAFTQAVAETRIDRNHRFILGAIDARERTNWTEEERQAQDVFISEVCDVLDSLANMVGDRFKVKSNEKGDAWHALSYLTESGATFSFKMETKFTHSPNKVWAETPEETPVPVVPKPKRNR
jgi:hypothetical protein